MATIDSLDIQIEGSVKKANNAVNSLVKNLDKLANSLKIDTSGLEKIGQAVDLSEISNGVKDIQKQMSGFEKSAKSSMNKVSKSINEVVKDSQNIGKGFRVEGSLSTIEKALQKYTNELEKAKLKEKELSAKGETDTAKYRDAVVDIQKYSNIIESLKKQLQSVKNTDILPEIKISGANDFKKSLDEYKKELEDFKNDIKSISDVYGGLQNVPKGFLDTPIQSLKQSIEELKQSYPQATNVISAFEKELQKLDDVAAGLTKEPVAVKVDTSSLDKTKDDISDKIKSLQSKFEDSGLDFVFEGNSEQLEKEIQKVNQEIDNLFNKQDRMIELGKVDTDSFKGVIRDIENASNRLKILEDARPDALNRTLEETQKKAKESEVALSEMNAKLKNLVVPPIREDNIEKLQAMLKKTEEELDRLRAKLANGLTMGSIKQSAYDKGFQNISAQIAVAEKRTEMLRNKIQDIGGSEKSTAGLETLSSSFRKLGAAAGKATTTIKSALKGISSVVSGAFSKIGQIGSRTASTIKNVASKIASSFAKIGSSSKSLKTAHSNLGNLLKTALGFVTIRGVFNFAKEAVNLGSSITEVENVVNTAFGSMAGHAYAFAATAKEQFGLSELAAKQYSGTMMAMLKSSGVMQAQAAKMSTTLAGLAGDIASFYNLETDEAFYKLRSAISGETEPMKQLGVNMNIVNLEAFAMSRGITKAYKDMTLAEQAMLRYNYILAKTTDAQGDFARTSGNYANQLRLLKTNFESLSAIIGQGLIAAILPAIKWLNALMSKLMEAAKVFRSFMYTLFGKVEGSQGGIVDDLGGITDGMEDIGDAAEEAGKKINKNLLLPIDELNVLSDTTDKLEDDLGIGDLGIGDFDIGDFELDKFEDIDTTPINKWAQAIRDAFLAQDWEGLGKTLAELVNAGLQKVYDAIIDITPKVEHALKDFAKVFNSFVEWLDWDLLGRTIGAGINLLTTSFNALFGDDGINLEMLGNKLSQGFRGMVDEIDWEDLGNALGNGFMIAWRVAYGFIWDMWSINPDTLLTGWEELGNGIAKAVNGIFDRIDFVKIAYTITHGAQGLIETLAAAIGGIDFEKIIRKFNEGLREFYDGLKWENGMGASITKLTTSIVNAFNDLLDIDFSTIGKMVGAGITDIIRAFNQLTDALGGIDFEKLGTNISNGLRGLVGEIPWNEFGNALGNGFMVAWRILDGFLEGMARENSAGLTGWQELGIAIGNAVNGIFEKIDFGTIANVLAMAFNGIIDSLKEATKTIDWEAISENLTNGLTTFADGIDWVGAGETLSNLIIELLGVFQRVANDFDWDGFGRSVGEFLSAIDWETIIGQVFDILWNVFGGFISGLFDTNSGKVVVAIGAGMALLEGIFKGVKLIKTVTDMVSTVSEIFGGLSISIGPTGIVIAAIVAAAAIIIANWDTIKEGAKLLKETVNEKFSEIKEKITDTWNGAKEKAHEVWDNVTGYLSETWESIKEKATTKFGEARDKAVNAWDGAKEKAQNAWNSIPEYLENKWESIKEKAKEFGETAKEKVTNVWNGVKEIYLAEWEAVKGAVSGVWESMKESALSIFNGIVDSVKGIFNGITEFLDGVFSGEWGKAWDGIVQVFKNSFNVLPTVIEGVLNFIIGSINSIFSGINGIVDKIPGIGESVPNIPTIPNVTLPRFSTGGFPEDGLFMANHTELVGKFANGRTAVANNEQITQGIRQAAYEGMIQALSEMSPYLADIAENTRRTAEKDISVRIGDRDIVDSYMRGRSRMGHVFTD